MSHRPYLALTMGDPAGIGPEVIVKALSTPLVWRIAQPLVIGSIGVFERTVRSLGSTMKVMRIKEDLSERGHSPPSRGHIPILDPLPRPLGRFHLGKAAPNPGKASVECIKTAVTLAQRGLVSGIVTAPINKEAIHLAGFSYPGHTELLAHLTNSKQVGMLILGGPLKILFATTHVAIRDLSNTLNQGRVLQAIQLAHMAMQKYFLISQPRIAVAGLNPHAGENGLFGHEEHTAILPATNQARDLGIKASRPLPADTLFCAAARGDYDAVVAMYHDQGLIPLKLLAFGKCVNLTVGLPIIRTSVDHGTAFDIVGKGKADPQSLIEAIKLAARLVTRSVRVRK